MKRSVGVVEEQSKGLEMGAEKVTSRGLATFG